MRRSAEGTGRVCCCVGGMASMVGSQVQQRTVKNVKHQRGSCVHTIGLWPLSTIHAVKHCRHCRRLPCCASHAVLPMLCLLTPLQVNINGNSALHFGAGEGHLDVVQALLAAGADPSPSSENGARPLHWAALGGHEQVVLALLKGGAPVSAANAMGDSPLHLACAKG